MARADRTIHEYVPDLGADEGSLLVSSGGAQPEAIVYRGEVLPAPDAGALQPDERPMRAGVGDGVRSEEPGRRSPTFRPDRVTNLQGNVGYYTVFTPTLAPFKRVTALDAVTLAADGTPVLSVGQSERRRVDVTGAHARPPDDRPRDRFWGSVVLDFSEGRTVPFPSVGPEARVLTLRTEPSVELRIEQDGAQNFYATVHGSEPAGSVRVVFLTDAPRSYFGREIPSGAVDARAQRLRPMPPQVARDAQAFVSDLGLSRQTSFERALFALVAHFRSFEESREPPADTGNIFLDLARGMRGICRHRAYGFVIAAQALGMHARFVQNEAHAWAEVELPADGGWLRVDLGGAATGLQAHGAADRPRYEPDVPDPLPRPAAYERAYAQAAQMSGLRRQSPAAGSEGSEPVGSATSSAPEAPGGDPAGPGGAGGSAPSRAPGAPGARSTAPGPSSPARGHLVLELDRQRFEVFRGQVLEVTGTARGQGNGVAGLRIEVLLQTARAESEWLLGVTVSREHGRFRGDFGIPPELPVGDYRLVVRSPGSDAWAPAQAR